jgi:hypothetical protein
MNNFNVDITSQGDIGPALALAFSKRGAAMGFSVQEVDRKADVTSWTPTLSREQRLVFFWAEPQRKEGFRPLAKFGFATAADLAKTWLDQVDYGPEPDHDGSNLKGWRIYNEIWGHVGGERTAIVAVTPRWAMLGK